MRPIPFDASKDLAPIPFDERLQAAALEMKTLGLAWQPHFGCFVWDVARRIRPDSPFPNRGAFFPSHPGGPIKFRPPVLQEAVFQGDLLLARLLRIDSDHPQAVAGSGRTGEEVPPVR